MSTSNSNELPEVWANGNGVRLSCGLPGEVTMTPERAREVAAELIAAADAVPPKFYPPGPNGELYAV